MTKYQLMQMVLASGSEMSRVKGSDGVVRVGIVNGLSREDGSGHSFVVRMSIEGKDVNVHVRTID